MMASSTSSKATVILPENTVKYRLYPLIRKRPLEEIATHAASPPLTSPSSSSSHTKSGPSSPTRSSVSPPNSFPQPTKEQLSLYVMESLAKLNAFLSNYIWQNESFNLHVRTDSLSPTRGLLLN
jgi:hypothetical protein